jgi:hypothetical protein
MKQTKAAPTTKTNRSAGMGNLFEKENLRWMVVGLVVMTIGFLLMAGGGSPDPNVFQPSEVYGFRRITVAPIIILAGLIVLIVAIFRKPKNS